VQILLFVSAAFGLFSNAAAETVAPVGCPIFHCTVEATGVMDQPIIQKVQQVNANSTLGSLSGQGCSGDGSRLSCLFGTDTTTGIGRGTLKALDATTLQPIWGSAAAPNSYNLDPSSSAKGQVPVMFSSGLISAGDATFQVLYDASGGVVGRLALDGHGNNFGLTPISDTYGIVSQTDGVLTLVNMSTWQRMDSLTLRDPDTGARIGLVSPSSASANVLYVVGGNPQNNRGLLYSVVMNPTTQRLAVRSTFTFTGRSEASPVVIAKGISGLSANLVLLHAPGLIGDVTPQNRLVGLKDNGSSLSPAWIAPLSGPLPVSPSIDRTTKTLFFQYRSDYTIHQYDFLSGTPVAAFDIRALGGFPAKFVLNGHLAAAQAGASHTLLLSGSIASTSANGGQYVMAFTPTATASTLLWVKKIGTQADQYTAAWNLGPSSRASVYCPIVVGLTSGITRLCD
jgi:hypothetical protein